MAPIHLNPADAVLAHKDLNSRISIAIHRSTFQQTHEGINQPEIDLNAALENQSVKKSDFIAPSFGKRIIVDTAEKL